MEPRPVDALEVLCVATLRFPGVLLEPRARYVRPAPRRRDYFFVVFLVVFLAVFLTAAFLAAFFMAMARHLLSCCANVRVAKIRVNVFLRPRRFFTYAAPAD